MSTELQLVPFHGNTIEAVMEEGRPWASIRSICSGLGLHLQAQHEKLRAKPWAVIRLIRTTAADGKSYETLCIDLDSLPMWLATIEPSRVKPAARDALVAYQKEAARVLRDHFLGHKPPQAPAVEEDAEVLGSAPDPRTPQERRELLAAVLAFPSLAQRSDRALAHLVRMSHTTVGRARLQFADGEPALRLGRDHRVIDTSLIGERPTREDRVEALCETILQEVRAGQAQRAPERLFTAKQMCAYLQITPRRWRDLYLGGDLDSAEVRLGEGEEELRWDPGAVLSLLRARRAS